MKRIELPPLGRSTPREEQPDWDELLPAGPFRNLVEALVPGSRPTEVQAKALREAKLLSSRRNLLVASSTNSGKSLLAYFALVRGLAPDRRVLLLEPLRALAQEKHAELSRLAGLAGARDGCGIPSVEITTGDYRLDHERMQAPPPEEGQVVIATPERIEAILRNPDFDPWVDSISTVVVDEAHLLGDPLRGASLEFVATSFKQRKAPPRFVLLSATLGDTAPIQEWLRSCDLVSCPDRYPVLRRSLLVAGPEDDLSGEIASLVAEILAEPGNGVLVFVYQTAGADKLARDLAPRLGDLAGPSGPRSYHSRQSAATRETVRREFTDGSCRCVVATTALAMGVNLPATHVVLRDLARPGEGPVRPEEIIQMTGRAGRGDREGHAYLVLKPKDPWTEMELVEALEVERLPPIRSALLSLDEAPRFRQAASPPPLAKGVLSLLGRIPEGGLSEPEIADFLRATLAGERAVSGLRDALAWLSSPSRVLAHHEEDRWVATTLGKAAIRASLPLEAAAGAAQLVRDLLSIDPEDVVLRGFSKLDLLILVELLSTGTSVTLRYSDKMAEQVDAWMGQSSEKSILFVRWLRGAEGFSKSDEILGSLGLSMPGGGGRTRPDHRKVAYVATCRAIILWQRGLGVSTEDLVKRWGVHDLVEIEEKWRDNRLFLLGALASIWELRCFYYHLREECEAGDERVRRVKRVFQRLGAHTYQLLDLVAWASPLGPFFVRMRRSLSGMKGSIPAHATLKRLEEHGIASVDALRALKEEDYQKMGVRKDLVRTIFAFLRRGG